MHRLLDSFSHSTLFESQTRLLLTCQRRLGKKFVASCRARRPVLCIFSGDRSKAIKKEANKSVTSAGQYLNYLLWKLMCKTLQQQFISSADFYQWVENKAFKIQLPGEL